jgi:hypothetical protein
MMPIWAHRHPAPPWIKVAGASTISAPLYWHESAHVGEPIIIERRRVKPEPNYVFSVGERVGLKFKSLGGVRTQKRYRGVPTFHMGAITACNKDRTLDVEHDDGSCDTHVTHDLTRPMVTVTTLLSFSVFFWECKRVAVH